MRLTEHILLLVNSTRETEKRPYSNSVFTLMADCKVTVNVRRMKRKFDSGLRHFLSSIKPFLLSLTDYFFFILSVVKDFFMFLEKESIQVETVFKNFSLTTLTGSLISEGSTECPVSQQ